MHLCMYMYMYLYFMYRILHIVSRVSCMYMYMYMYNCISKLIDR